MIFSLIVFQSLAGPLDPAGSAARSWRRCGWRHASELALWLNTGDTDALASALPRAPSATLATGDTNSGQPAVERVRPFTS
jgi:hypothetical protein